MNMTVFGLSLAAALATITASAQVKFYERGKPGQSINLRHQLVEIRSQLNKDQEVRDFLKNSSDHFTQLNNKNINIALKKEVSDHLGASLRYKQLVKGVVVQGAEVIAIYNKTGQLKTVNSSLKTLPADLDVTPTINTKEALDVAAQVLEISLPTLGNHELRVVERNGEYVLVWNLAVRSPNFDSRSSSIQIVANGPQAGSVFSIRSLHHQVAATTKVSVIDANDIPDDQFPSQDNPGKPVIFNDEPLVDDSELSEDAQKAFKNLKRALKFYEDSFNRISFDNLGTAVPAYVRMGAISGNAAWIGEGFNVFIFGKDSDMLKNLPGALDVVGHEITHGVITHSSNLLYEKQSGALNEHFADVFGEMIEVAYGETGGELLIGEHTVSHLGEGRALRNMLRPELGLSKQPGHTRDTPAIYGPDCIPVADRDSPNYNDNCGVHILSGIPNKAAAKIIQEVGFSASQNLFYRVMTTRLTSNAQFVDYKNQMIDECAENLPAACDVIEDAFAGVGL